MHWLLELAWWQYTALYLVGACLTAFLCSLFGMDDDNRNGFAMLWPFFAVVIPFAIVYLAPFALGFSAINTIGKLGKAGYKATAINPPDQP